MGQGIREGSHKLGVKQDEKSGGPQPQESNPLSSLNVVAVDFSTPLIPCLPDSSLSSQQELLLGQVPPPVTTHISGDLFCFQ